MNSETSVVRIIHLDDFTTEYSLKEFLSTSLLLGAIKNVFINKDNELQIVFAYVIFEYSRDAKTVVTRLNGFCFQNKVLEIELIGVNLPYKRYTTQTSESNYVPNPTNRLQRKFRNLNITSPKKNLDSQSNDPLTRLHANTIKTGHPGNYRNIFQQVLVTYRNTSQPGDSTVNSGRFNNDGASSAVSNILKAKNDTPQAGTCTSRVSGSSSSASHLRRKTNTFNKISSKATNNEIQPHVSTNQAAKLQSTRSTVSHPDASTSIQTSATSLPLSSTVNQSNTSAPGTLSLGNHQLNTSARAKSPVTSHSSLRSATLQPNTSTRAQTPPTSAPLSSVNHLSNASTRIKISKTSCRPLTPTPSHSSLSSAVQNTSTRAQTPPTSAPLSSVKHLSNASTRIQISKTSCRPLTPIPSHSSLSSAVQNTSTRAQTPPTSSLLSSAVHQSTASTPGTCQPSSLVKHKLNTSTGAQTPATSHPLLPSATSHPSLPSAIQHPNTSARAQTPITLPVYSAVHQSNASAPGTSHLSSSVKHHSNASTKTQTPTASYHSSHIFEHRPVSIEPRRKPKEPNCVIS